jgi:hypothetical protein
MVWSIFSSANEYPPVQLLAEEGFVDLQFQISKVNNSTFTVKGTLSEKKVGFSVQLLPDWKAQDVEGLDTHFYWGAGKFISTGRDTKNFLVALADLYGFNIEDIEVTSSVTTDIVSLSGNPKDIMNTPCKMKFFFGPDAEEYYSEIFINIDAQLKTLEFNEKDIDYRAPLIKSLLGGA